MDLEGRVVVVAGAGGGGIGTAVCRALARHRAAVVALDINAEALAAVDEAVAGTPGPHRCLVADVGDEGQLAAALDEVADLGALHGLVHVAGGLWRAQWASLLTVPLETWDDVLARNLRSALVSMRSAAARMVAGATGGSIVAVSSIAGLSAMPYGAPYAAAKAGLVSLTRTAALEWGHHGIRVNAVAPGTVRTPKIAGDGGAAPDDLTDREREALPLGRRGVPDDVAGAVVFLVSDMAGWITGQVLPVDGGSSARPSFLGSDDLPVFVHDEAMKRLPSAGGA